MNRIKIFFILMISVVINSCEGDILNEALPSDSTVYTSYGIMNITTNCIVTVKAWGAGGQGGISPGGDGGGGGYSCSVFTAGPGDILHIVVGVGGGNTVDSNMPALGGTNGHIGGGGSLVALYKNNTFTLKCCAGGGGAGGAGITGGAGGGSSGGSDSYTTSTGGNNGSGGTGTYNGSAMSLTAATILGFSGNGGAGGGAEGGAAGGGYGGGGTSGTSGVCYGGSGGGGYCEGSGSTTVAGSGITPGNNTDSDLPAGYAVGGAYANTIPNYNSGGNGYVIVTISYK